MRPQHATDATVATKAHLYAGEMGLSVYPLIGGNLTALHAAMARSKVSTTANFD